MKEHDEQRAMSQTGYVGISVLTYNEMKEKIKSLEDENMELREEVEDWENERNLAWDEADKAEAERDALREKVMKINIHLEECIGCCLAVKALAATEEK